jgi:hypothetical protein
MWSLDDAWAGRVIVFSGICILTSGTVAVVNGVSRVIVRAITAIQPTIPAQFACPSTTIVDQVDRNSLLITLICGMICMEIIWLIQRIAGQMAR